MEVTADGHDIPVTSSFHLSVTIRNEIRLTLGAAIRNGQSVVVHYTDPDPTGDDNSGVFQSNDRIDLPSFVTGQGGFPAVINNSEVAGAGPPEYVSGTVIATGDQIELRFDRDLDIGNLPRTNAFEIHAGGNLVSIGGVSSIEGFADRFRLTQLSPLIRSGQYVTLRYLDPPGDDTKAIQDTDGFDGGSFYTEGGGFADVVNDSTVAPPTLASASVDSDGTLLQLIFNKDVDVNHAALLTDFEITADGNTVTAGSLSYAGDNSKALNLRSLSPAIRQGQDVIVIYTDPSDEDDTNAIQNTDGLDAASFTTGQDNVPDVTNGSTLSPRPKLASAQVLSSGTNIRLQFDRNLDLDTAILPGTLTFSVTADGAEVSIGTFEFIIGDATIIGLADVSPAIRQGESVIVSYTDPSGGDDTYAIQDTDGVDAASFTTGQDSVPGVTNNSAVAPPTLTSASVDSDGTLLQLIFNKDVDVNHAALLTDFEITADGNTVTAGSLSYAGDNSKALNLRSLSPAIRQGQDVIVIYTDPSDEDDTNAIQNTDGLDAASFTTGQDNVPDVTNGSTLSPRPKLASAQVLSSGTNIRLQFDRNLDLDTAILPGTLAFSVTADGAEVSIGTFEFIIGDATIIGLADVSPAIRQGESVIVSYTDPSGGDDTYAIQDTDGVDAASFTTGQDSVPGVTNNSTVAPPTLASAAVDSDGTRITLWFDRDLDIANLPPEATFQITADGAEVGFGNLAVFASVPNSVALADVSPAIRQGESVIVSYTEPSDEDDTNAIQETNGVDAASFTTGERGVPGVTNGSTLSPRPKLVSVNIDFTGNRFDFTFDKNLEPQSTQQPPTTAFSITASGYPVSVGSVGVLATDNKIFRLLHLSPKIRSLETVTVVYTDPSPEDDPKAIQDSNGVDAASFTHTFTDTTGLAAVRPGKPRNLTATAGSTLADQDTIALQWNPPSDHGGRPLTGYKVEVSADAGASWSDLETIGAGRTSHTHSGLPPDGVTRHYRVSAVNSIGTSDPTGPVSAATVDLTRPELSATEPPLVARNGRDIHLFFNEDLETDSSLHPPAGAFTVTADGSPVTVGGAISAPASGLSDAILLSQLSPLIGQGQDVIVTYTDPTSGDDPAAIQDASGNDAASFATGEGGVLAVINESEVAAGPRPSSAEVEASGDRMLVFFTVTLESDASRAPPASAFTVTAGRRTVTVGSAAISSSDAIVLSSFDPLVLPGQDVTVSYTDPGTGDDANAVQDADGLDAPSFADFPVTNNSEAADTFGPVLVSATVPASGNVITLVFDEDLDSTNLPAATAFAITAGGRTVIVDQVMSAGQANELNLLGLSLVIGPGDVVTLTYTDPTDADDAAAIQDALGNDAESFTTGEGGVPAVVNDSTPAVDRIAPEFVNGGVVSSGTGLNLFFDEDLDLGNLPAASAFTITAGGSPVRVGNVSVPPTGRNVLQVTNVSPTILLGQDVVVTYTDPTGGNDAAAIQDALGNDAASFTTGEGDVPAVANGSTVAVDLTGPAPSSAEVEASGDRMLVFFTVTLESDASKAPPASAFTVTAGPRTVSVGSAAVSSSHTDAIVLSALDPLVLPGQVVTVSYTDPGTGDDANAVQDANGLDAASFANFPVTNNSEAADTFGPVLVSATVETNGFNLRLDFDEALDGSVASWAPLGAFEVTVDGVSVTPVVALTGANNVLLRVSLTIAQGQVVTVTYTDPTGGDDAAAIQDALGNDAETFTTGEGDVPAVANNSTQADVPDVPDAPGSLKAMPGVRSVTLDWVAPFDGGSAITTYEYRQKAGSAAFGDWTDVPDSGPGTTSYEVPSLTEGATYTFEVRAVNAIGDGAAAGVTDVTLPVWAFTLSSNTIDEGGAAVTATAAITNDVRFSTDQTVRLTWGGAPLGGAVRGAGGENDITVAAHMSSGSLALSAPGDVGFYTPPQPHPLAASYGGVEIGSHPLTLEDNEPQPAVTVAVEPSTVTEGESITLTATLTGRFTSPVRVDLKVEPEGALSGTAPVIFRFAVGQDELALTVTIADNGSPDPQGRTIKFTLEAHPDFMDYYTLGSPPDVTVKVGDAEFKPTKPLNFEAQAGDTEATLTWDAPAATGGQPVLRYEVSRDGGAWLDVGTATTYRATGLDNGTSYTFEVRAVTVNGEGAVASDDVTPIEGVAVAFGAAAHAVDEGGSVTVTVTLGEAPSAAVTVQIEATAGAELDSNEYSGVPQEVLFNAGQASRSFMVVFVDDAEDEGDETLTLGFGALPEGYVAGTPRESVLTVRNNDHPAVAVGFAAEEASAPEGGEVEVAVRLDRAPEREVVVPIAASPGANLAATSTRACRRA